MDNKSSYNWLHNNIKNSFEKQCNFWSFTIFEIVIMELSFLMCVWKKDVYINYGHYRKQ